MRYNEINWDDVESATATNEGLVLTYRTPQIGVGQTQVVPLALEGTVGQAREFNARFGPTLAVFTTRSPAGSYGQVPNQSFESHYVKIVLKRYEIWEGVYHGAIDWNFQKFVCAKIAEKYLAAGISFLNDPAYNNTLVNLWIDGKPATTLCNQIS